MNRRAVLALLASGTAGCLDGVPGTPARESIDDTRSPTATPTPGPVAGASLGASLRYISLPDRITVEPPSNDQFLLVMPPASLSDDEPAPRPGDFSLWLAGESFEPSAPDRAISQMPGAESFYTEEEPSGWLVFDVPTADADRGALSVAGGARHPLPTETLAAADAVPEFHRTGISIPETVPAGDTYEVAVDVENRGGREGIYLAGVQRGGLPDTLEARVPAGSSATARVTLEAFGEPGDRQFVWVTDATGGEEFPVRIISE